MRYAPIKIVRYSALLASASIPAVAIAQTAVKGAAAAATEEIVVTAQRRSESLQKVPMAVSVASGEQIQNLAIFDIKDIQQLAPGLEMTNNDGRRNVASIRGITFEPDSAASPAVDIFFNDIPVDAQSLFGAIYDVGQIEVLRGPQGIFRGRTSPAGAITMTTRRANLNETEGYVQASGTSRDGLNVQFGASVPLMPGVLALRVAGLSDFNRAGQVRSVSGKESAMKTESGRVSLAFKPTERFRGDLTFQRFDADISPQIAVFGPGNAPFAGVGVTDRTGPPLTLEDRRTVFRTYPHYKNLTDLTTLNTELEVADKIVWSLDAGFQSSKLDQNYTVGNLEASIPGGVLPNSLSGHNKTKTIDTRLSSNNDGPFNWMFGAFRQDVYGDPTRFNSGADFVTVAYPFFPIVQANALLEIPQHNSTQAIFGSVRYKLTDALRFEAGMRHTKYQYNQQAYLQFCSPLFGGCFPAVGPGTPALTSDMMERQNKATTGGATLSYDWTPELTTYVAYGRSYRPPAAQLAAAISGTTTPELLVSKPEKSDSIELGVKSSMLDRRLSWSVDVFVQKYKGYIEYFPGLVVRTPMGGLTGIATATNGDAISKGIEMQLTARPTRNLDLGLSFSYTKANYDNAEMPCNMFDTTTGASGIPVGKEFAVCTRNDRIAQMPSFSASMNGEYRFKVDGLTPFIRGLVNYRPGFSSSFDNFKYSGFTNASLFLGVRGGRDDQWEVSFFVKNLLDQTRALRVSNVELQQQTVQFDFATPGTTALSGYRTAVITNPREFGLTARYNW